MKFKIFWIIALIIVWILIPEKILYKIDALQKPLRVTFYILILILTLAVATALTYVFYYLPLDAMFGH